MNILLSSIVGLACAYFTSAALAASPVGLWKTIDDETGNERSLIRIIAMGESIEGTVENIILFPGDDPEQLCRDC